jgi:hypothetical protein
MLRGVYCWLLRLHPARFRKRFDEEMLSIFDHAAGAGESARLVGDAAISVVRQWALRSEYQQEARSEPVPWSPQGPPVFYIFEHYIPRRSSLWAGALFAFALCCATWIVSRYTWNHPVFMPTIRDAGLLGAVNTDAPRVRVPSQPNTKLMISIPAHETASADVRNSATVSPQATAPVSTSNSRSQQSAPTSTSVVQHPARALVSLTPPERALRPYIGIYAADPPNHFLVVVTAAGPHLEIHIPGESAATLLPIARDKFAFIGKKNAWVEFEKNGHGIAEGLSVSHNGRRFTAERTN